MKKAVRKALIGSGSAAAAAGLAIGTKKLVNAGLVSLALDKNAPKLLLKARGLVTGQPEEHEYSGLERELSEKLLQREHERVEIDAFDGTRLVGHILRAEHPKRYVIAMHGWRTTWNIHFGVVADFWYDHDTTVLYVEERGQGESGGEYMGFGLLERHDCVTWAKWFCEHEKSELPFYLYGVSMGAAAVLMATGSEELPGEIRAVIADCGYTSPEAIWKHVSEDNMHIPYALLRPDVDRACMKRIAEKGENYSTLRAMEVNQRPVLFIHGKEDSFVPVAMTMANYEACKAPKSLLIVEDADHAMSYYVHPEIYFPAIEKFLSEQEAE